MPLFIEAIITTIAVSAFLAAIFYILYLTAVKGSESALQLYNRFKKGYSEHSRNKRVGEKMNEYKAISNVGRKPFLHSVLPFSFFLLVILVLLFKLVFFTAIVSDSMQPTFKKGDLVLMQKVSVVPEEGDIIMFEQPNYMLPITHRVIALTDEGVRTAGDAVGRADPWIVHEEEIMAKAVQVEEKPLVIEDVGNYFILDAREMRYNPKYGSEYTFVKNIFLTLRVYGYAVCILAIMGYVILTLKEAKKR